jgi:UDP:flavonoid glycosyltransferase YjiC (YdhE family)
MSASPMNPPKQFLFAMFQGGGNIPPILAVAHQLVTRGHRVCILAGPDLQPDRPPRPPSATFLDGIRTIGATLIPLHLPQDPFAGLPPARGLLGGWTPRGFRVNVFLARRFLAAPVWADDVREELTRQPADVVVADFHLLGVLAAAEAAGTPAAALVHHPHIRPTPGMPPFGPGWGPARGLLGRLRDTLGHAIVERIYRRDGVQALNQVRRQCSLPPLRSPLQQYDAAARVLIMTSPAFDLRPRALPPNVRYVGMPVEDVRAATWESPWAVEDVRPLTLVSLSTAPQGQVDVLRRTLTALGEIPVRGLVTLGPAMAQEQFQAPANVVLTPFVPHALVLPQVTAIVSQCGHGTVMKALAHGVPLVCLPLWGDQPDIAARVVPAGAGIRLPQGASSTAIRTALQRIMTTPGFRDGAQRLAKAMAVEDGAKTTADALETLAAHARPQVIIAP